MPKITYIEHDGTVHTVEAEIGSTVMETAQRNNVASIVAECGGSCTCATCLVHVDEKWFAVVGPPSAEEEDMLDFAFEVKPTSRLSCQIKVTEALDGLIVRTPAYQGRCEAPIAAPWKMSVGLAIIICGSRHCSECRGTFWPNGGEPLSRSRARGMALSDCGARRLLARVRTRRRRPGAGRMACRSLTVIPARDEAEGVGDTIASLLQQDYPGAFSVILVDDQSTDGTADVARRAAAARARTG